MKTLLQCAATCVLAKNTAHMKIHVNVYLFIF